MCTVPSHKVLSIVLQANKDCTDAPVRAIVRISAGLSTGSLASITSKTLNDDLMDEA